MNGKELLEIIQKRRSVRVYKTGKVSEAQLDLILEAARWAPSGANTQPWEFVVTRDRKKMRKARQIYDQEWKQRKLTIFNFPLGRSRNRNRWTAIHCALSAKHVRGTP